jgi:hypothetical protein
MFAKSNRQVFGVAIGVTRTMGLILIALAILGLPQMRFLTGRLAISFDLIMSIALGLMGVAWLVGVRLFVRFFDRYLSRN